MECFSFTLTFKEVEEEEGRVPVYRTEGVGDREIVFSRPGSWSYQNFYESRSVALVTCLPLLGVVLQGYDYYGSLSGHHKADLSGCMGSMFRWCLLDDTGVLSIP